MASLQETLQSQGWYISEDGLKKICETDKITDAKTIIRKALDFDIKEIGAPVLETEIYKTTCGPVVLQVVKLRNASAPKSKQTSQGAPRMLKLVLTDGHLNCPAFEFRPLSFLNPEKTSPGTKVLISGAQISAGTILLSPENCRLLGGTVSTLIDKWEISKLMPSHVRINDDGPPTWVNFGKKVVSNLSNQGFKSLEAKNKDNSKENSEFQNQRQDAIAEAAQGAIKKVFGGGVKPAQTLINSQESRFTIKNDKDTRGPRQSKQKGKDKSEPEKMEKPSQRISLFDYLENKLPATEITQPKTQYSTNSKVDVTKFKEFPDKKSNQKLTNKFNKNSYTNRPESFNANSHSNRQDYSVRYDSLPNSSRQDYNLPRQDNNSTRQDYNSTRQDYNSTRQDFNPPRLDYTTIQPDYITRQNYHAQNSIRHETTPRQDNTTPPKFSQDNRYHQNDRPPRFQKQQRSDGVTNKFSFATNSQMSSSESRSKPNTNHFIDKLTTEINNISLYNSKYENEKLNKNPPLLREQRCCDPCKPWKWKVGDRCMAKYWEDDKFYNAVVTGITNKTCMVEFSEYGNFEEVLHCDCIPITTEDQDNFPDRSKNNNQAFSGSLEFRRGKNRPFVHTPNKSYGQNRNYES